MTETQRLLLRRRFPTLAERNYLASQSLGLFPADMLADLDEYRQTLLLRNRALPAWLDRMAQLTALFEALLGAPAGSVALVSSATAAHAAVVSALTPRAGRDRILVSALDFHSTRHLLDGQARRGFTVEVVPADDDGMEVTPARWRSALSRGDVALIAAAMVSPRSGALIDAAALAHNAHAAGALLALDVYQAVGIVPLDVSLLGADIVVGGTHKWLGGGGTGLAFLYVEPSLAESLQPAYPGWLGHRDLLAFSPTFVAADGARRFQQGTIGLEPVYTARAGLRCALEVGVDVLRQRSLVLTQRLLDRAAERGLLARTPAQPERRGGMICLDLPEGPVVVSRLGARGIDIDTRPGAGVRIGPHPCTSEAECDDAIDAIAEGPTQS